MKQMADISETKFWNDILCGNRIFLVSSGYQQVSMGSRNDLVPGVHIPRTRRGGGLHSRCASCPNDNLTPVVSFNIKYHQTAIYYLNQWWPSWPICQSHNALDTYPTMHQLITEMCTREHFCYKMVHFGIWDWCIMGFVQQVYSLTQYDVTSPAHNEIMEISRLYYVLDIHSLLLLCMNRWA